MARRLDSIEMRAKSITLKIMIRDPDSPVEPPKVRRYIFYMLLLEIDFIPKFMGHGICNVMNKQAALNAIAYLQKVGGFDYLTAFYIHTQLFTLQIGYSTF